MTQRRQSRRNYFVSRRGFLASAGAAGLAGGFPSIISARAFAQTSGGVTKIILGDGPFISKGGAMVAFEKGFFKKLGLDVEYKWFADGGLIISPVLAGEVDIGSLTPSAGMFNSIARGANIQMFLDGGTKLSQKHSYAVTVVSQKLWDDGVRKPEDLPKIADLTAHMSVKGSFNEFILDRTYMKGGVDPNKVTSEYGLPQPGAMQLMMKGGVNISNFAYQFAWLMQKEKKAQPIAFGYDVAPGAVISCYSYSMDKLKAKGRETFVRFAMAYLEGVRIMREAASADRPSNEVIAILTKHTLFKGDRGRQMLLDIHPHWGELKADGKPHREGISMMQDHWVDVRKYVERKVDINQLANQDIAEEAGQRLRKENPFKNM
jgi:NitT/TauT family transport system substrate-binding protein